MSEPPSLRRKRRADAPGKLSATRILKVDFCRNDPLMRLLRDRLRLSPWTVAAAWLLLWILDSRLGSVLAGVYESSPGVVGFRQDFLGQIGETLVPVVVVLGYYIWSGSAFTNLLWQLARAGSLWTSSSQDQAGEPRHDYLWAMNQLDRVWNRPAWTVGALLAALAWTVLVMRPVSLTWPLWWCVRRSLHTYFLTKFAIVAYALMRVIQLDFLGLYSLSKLVRWKCLVFQPYHPDDAGGLLDIGRYRLAFVYALLGASVYMVASAMRQTILGFVPPGAVLGPLNMSDIVVYALCLLMLPLSFFMPVWTVHWFMESEKSRLTTTLAKVSERAIDRSSGAGAIPEPVEVEKLTKLVTSLKTLREIPEWPINGAVLRRFAGSWLSLAVSPLVGKLIDSLVRLP